MLDLTTSAVITGEATSIHCLLLSTVVRGTKKIGSAWYLIIINYITNECLSLS